MTFWEIYLLGLVIILAMMSLLWIASGILKNASIVDSFWGLGFVLVAFHYFAQSSGLAERKMLVLSLLFIWAIRLTLYILWRNWGRGEDFRYRQVREDHGPRGYWWSSFRKVFLLQGFVLWVVSAPLLAAQYYGKGRPFGWIDVLGLLVWIGGFYLGTMSDYQLVKFKSKPANRDKTLTTGLWKFCRHPNYFGDALVWWAFGLFAIGSGGYISLIGPALMTFLLVKVTGALLEETLIDSKLGYRDYMERTSSFFPWFPKK